VFLAVGAFSCHTCAGKTIILQYEPVVSEQKLKIRLKRRLLYDQAHQSLPVGRIHDRAIGKFMSGDLAAAEWGFLACIEEKKSDSRLRAYCHHNLAVLLEIQKKFSSAREHYVSAWNLYPQCQQIADDLQNMISPSALPRARSKTP